MAVNLGLQIVEWVNRLARRVAAKPDASGIMKIPNRQAVIDTTNEILTKFKKHGVPNDMIRSENDVKVIYNQILNLEDQQLRRNVISPGDPRHKEITEKLLGKKKTTADLIDLGLVRKGKNVKKTTPKEPVDPKLVEEVKVKETFEDATKRFNQTDIVADTVTRIISMEPVAALKEANKVIGRKGIYKNLTKEQSQKILKDSEDWIFQRDPDDLYDYNKKRPFRDDADPEDFAQGGIAGMLGERTNYSDGGNGEDDSMVGISMSIEERWERIKKLLKQMEDIKSGKTTDPNPEDKAAGGRIGTGLNYLLGEDDQNVRVPYGNGSSWEQFQKEKLMRTWEEYQQYLKNREKEKKQKPYIEERLGTGPGPVLEAADGGRIGLKKGYSAGRRKFLQGIGALAALPVVGKFFKWAKPAAKVADVASVPIKAGVDGMPAWFKPLVNRVIKEGDDVTKKFATKEREIVHTKKIDDVDEVTVYQDLDTGNVTVEYGYHLTDDTGKVIRASNDPEVIHLSYKAAEEIPLKGKKGSVKTKEEFSAVEAEPEITNWDGDIDMTGVNEVNKIDDLITDTSKLQKYATGEKLTIKELSESMKKQKYKNKLETDTTEAINYIEKKHGPFPDPGDYSGGKDSTIEAFDKYYKKASGGRVPLGKGGIAGMLGE